MSETNLTVEVAYAESDNQCLIELSLPVGSTIQDALDASGLFKHYPGLNKEQLAVGIFATLCETGHILQSGDRVEIYRPLLKNPKDARRQRAKQQH